MTNQTALIIALAVIIGYYFPAATVIIVSVRIVQVVINNYLKEKQTEQKTSQPTEDEIFW